MRTDIHAPASDQFDPELYTFQDVVDLNPDPEFGMEQIAYFNRVVRGLEGDGYRWAAHQDARGWGQCGHCGARIRYAALLSRDDAMELIVVGEQCLDNRFESGLTKGKFQQLRKAALLNAEQAAKRAQFVQLCDVHPVLAYATYSHNIGIAGATFDPVDEYQGYASEALDSKSFERVTRTGWELSVMGDIVYKAKRYGHLSDAQAAFLDKLMTQLGEKAVKAEQWAAEAAAAGPVPTGRVTITGEVLSTKVVENDWTSTLKMMVKLDNGSRVWSTVPAAMDVPERGNRVQFVATVTAADDDPTMGFAKRPTKGVIL